MCELDVYYFRESKEKIFMKSVDIIESIGKGKYKLIDIFGDKIEINGVIESINLSESKILFK